MRFTEKLEAAARRRAIEEELLESRPHLVGILIRHESAGEFHAGVGGDDRLAAGGLVAAVDAVGIAGRS